MGFRQWIFESDYHDVNASNASGAWNYPVTMKTVLIALSTLYTNLSAEPTFLALKDVGTSSLQTRWSEWRDGNQTVKAGMLIVGTL